MDSFRKTIFDFVTQSQERFQTAYEIAQSWEEIRFELIRTFQKEVASQTKERLADQSDASEIKVETNEKGWAIWIYKTSWEHEEDVWICPKVERMNGEDYWGIWRYADRVKPQVKQVQNEYWKQKGLRQKRGDDVWWFFYEYTGNDFRNIDPLIQLLKEETRKPLVDRYSKTLAGYFMEYESHIDFLIDAMRKE